MESASARLQASCVLSKHAGLSWHHRNGAVTPFSGFLNESGNVHILPVIHETECRGGHVLRIALESHPSPLQSFGRFARRIGAREYVDNEVAGAREKLDEELRDSSREPGRVRLYSYCSAEANIERVALRVGKLE